jgi:fatty acid desaturase
MRNKNKSTELTIPTLVFLVFLTLKLAGIGRVADWSWWWVTSPLWIPVIFLIIVFFVNKNK